MITRVGGWDTAVSGEDPCDPLKMGEERGGRLQQAVYRAGGDLGSEWELGIYS